MPRVPSQPLPTSSMPALPTRPPPALPPLALPTPGMPPPRPMSPTPKTSRRGPAVPAPGPGWRPRCRRPRGGSACCAAETVWARGPPARAERRAVLPARTCRVLRGRPAWLCTQCTVGSATGCAPRAWWGPPPAVRAGRRVVRPDCPRQVLWGLARRYLPGTQGSVPSGTTRAWRIPPLAVRAGRRAVRPDCPRRALCGPAWLCRAGHCGFRLQRCAPSVMASPPRLYGEDVAGAALGGTRRASWGSARSRAHCCGALLCTAARGCPALRRAARFPRRTSAREGAPSCVALRG